MTLSGRTLWYIETHITDDLSLDSIALAAAVSRFHLSRAFTASTGLSLTAYVRARRLTHAATQLAAGAPNIIQVAFDAGYGSHEAFTRAFKQQFGVTPDDYRARPSTDIPLQEPLRMNPTSTASLNAPRFADRGELRIFGIGEECTQAGAASIPAQWGRFGPVIGTIENRIGSETYGVIANYDDSGAYRYTAAVEVRAFPQHPADFDRLTIPAQTYAVFEHHGHISEIAATWRAIWEQGMPGGYQAIDAPSFEQYGPQFDGRTGLGGCEIWIPVRRLGDPGVARLIRAMLFVKDLPKVESFYTSALGLEPIQLTRLDTYVEFPTGFALHAIPTEIAAGIQISDPPTPREAAPTKLTFAVSNLEAAKQRLVAAGAQLLRRPWGAEEWTDPEGNIFAITEG